MKFDMPKALFSGLALIAAAIYFGPDSARADKHYADDVQKVVICENRDLIDHIAGIVSCGNEVEVTNYPPLPVRIVKWPGG